MVQSTIQAIHTFLIQINDLSPMLWWEINGQGFRGFVDRRRSLGFPLKDQEKHGAVVAFLLKTLEILQESQQVFCVKSLEFQVVCSLGDLLQNAFLQISCDSDQPRFLFRCEGIDRKCLRRTPKRPKRQKRKWPMTKVAEHSAWHFAWCNHLTSWPGFGIKKNYESCKQVKSSRRGQHFKHLKSVRWNQRRVSNKNESLKSCFAARYSWSIPRWFSMSSGSFWQFLCGESFVSMVLLNVQQLAPSFNRSRNHNFRQRNAAPGLCFPPFGVFGFCGLSNLDALLVWWISVRIESTISQW